MPMVCNGDITHLQHMKKLTADCNSDDELKAALCERAEVFCRYLFPNGKRDGHNYVVGSLQGETGKSLSICLTGPKTGIFNDFSTGEGGNNLLELLRASRALDFAAACREVRAWLGLPAIPRATAPIKPRRIAPTKPHESAPYRVSDAEAARGTRMAERLINDPRACDSIARRRQWHPDTVFGLAQEASLGLSESDRLVFLYDTGAKERWREGSERQMRFLFGKADSLWRGGLLSIAVQVFICEGETDAISLIDAGAEEAEGSLVVALPGAGIFKPHWTRQLAGKAVILCLDADDAGKKATEKHKATLAPHAASLRTVNLEALLK